MYVKEGFKAHGKHGLWLLLNSSKCTTDESQWIWESKVNELLKTENKKDETKEIEEMKTDKRLKPRYVIIPIYKSDQPQHPIITLTLLYGRHTSAVGGDKNIWLKDGLDGGMKVSTIAKNEFVALGDLNNPYAPSIMRKYGLKVYSEKRTDNLACRYQIPSKPEQVAGWKKEVHQMGITTVQYEINNDDVGVWPDEAGRRDIKKFLLSKRLDMNIRRALKTFAFGFQKLDKKADKWVLPSRLSVFSNLINTIAPTKKVEFSDIPSIFDKRQDDASGSVAVGDESKLSLKDDNKLVANSPVNLTPVNSRKRRREEFDRMNDINNAVFGDVDIDLGSDNRSSSNDMLEDFLGINTPQDTNNDDLMFMNGNDALGMQIGSDVPQINNEELTNTVRRSNRLKKKKMAKK
eukprot:TRINITY_DN318_c0_g1_i12.p1 TRINITY_DN318_c0_g1~~TRINITY_DN318_c0_g1_i12.p1  ORF type:complete len:405 (-),score=96.95 TRINITY_DN318_c0_g1_i12:681-1895(-)